MLGLDVAAALSAWYRAPRSAIRELLAQPSAPTTLEGILDALGIELRSPLTRDELRRCGLRALERARRSGIAALPWGDPAYPDLLAPISDPPLLLWIRGAPKCLQKPTVAIVGSRAATSYGLEAASRLAGDLAAAGVVVVSGLARGIDSAAHRGALAAGGETVAVLGSGVDVIYPPEHGRLAAEIAVRGAVVSELPPGSQPAAFHFPARNRIISGLSRIVVVVEAAARSGSLITAGCALDQGRVVMAVPGSVLTGRHRGSHALIRDGAAPVESAEDVIAELRLDIRSGADRLAGPAGGEADPVLAAMSPGEAYDTGALVAETGLAAAQLLPRLLQLELRGTIRRVEGGRFVRAERTC